MSLTRQTVRAVVWSYGVTAIMMALQVVFTGIMGRLVPPSAYGLVATAYVVVRFGSHFSHLGIGPALIQAPSLRPVETGTAYTTAFASGVLFFVVTWLSAPAVVKLFPGVSVSELLFLLRLSGIAFLLSPLTAVSICLLRREMHFGTIAAVELSAFVLGMAGVALPTAYLGWGAYSVVLGALAQAVFLLAFSLFAIRTQVRLSFSLSALRRLLSYGGRYSAIGFLEMLTYTSDLALMSRFFNSTVVGTYSRASYLIQVPAQQIAGVVNKVGFASLSRASADRPRLTSAFMSAMLLLGVLLFPFCIGMSIASEEVVPVVLGPSWDAAVPLLRVLAMAVPFHLSLHLSGILLDATNRLRLKLTLRCVHLVVLLLLYFALRNYEGFGFAIAFLITEATFHFVYLACVAHCLDIPQRELLRVHRTILVVSVVVAALVVAAMASARAMALPTAAVLILEGLAGAGGLALCFVWFPAGNLRATILNRIINGFERPSVGAVAVLLGWYERRLRFLDRRIPTGGAQEAVS